jgi:hypothetical protein
MDFHFSDEQTTIRDLARGILEKEVTPERVKRIEQTEACFDDALWSTLAEAGLLGLAAPEEHGGMGFGVAEVCTLLGEIGRVVAPVPVLPTLVLGGLPIAEFGTEEQRERWLPPMLAGEAVFTAALVDSVIASDGRPGTTAHRHHDGWLLDGSKREVPAIDLAARCLVPASIEGSPDVGLFLVDPESAGVSLVRSRTSTGQPLFTVELDGVRVETADMVGGPPGALDDARIRMDWLSECALVATAALQVGVSERAVEMTADYVREREQFGVPIGSFQAVQHRMADAYMDLNAMRWTMWRAAWKLAHGHPAARDAMVVKFWSAEGGARIAATAQHLHAGMGVDVDYPIHRYYLWSKALELSLGASALQLARLGRDMAAAPPKQESAA